MTCWEFVRALLNATKGVAWNMPLVINHKGNAVEIESIEVEDGPNPQVIVLLKGDD